MPATAYQSPTLQRAGIALGALAVLVLLLLWSTGSLDLEPQTGNEPPTDAPAARGQVAVAAAAERPEDRETIAQRPPDRPPPPVADLDLPYRFEVRLQVVDRYGLPVEGATLFAAPRRCGFGMHPTATDALGRATLLCRGRTETLELWLLVLAFGIAEPARVVRLLADRPLPVFVVARGEEKAPRELLQLIERYGPERGLREAAADAARGRYEQRRPRPGQLQRRDDIDLLCGRSIWMYQEMLCYFCHDTRRLPTYGALQRAPSLGAGLHPFAVFVDQPLGPLPPESRRERSRELVLPAVDRSRERLEQEFGRDRLGSVHGVVHSQQGAPVANAAVAWIGTDGGVRLRTATDDSGEYRLTVPVGGPCTLVAAGAGFGRDEQVVFAGIGSDTERSFTLQTTAVIRGRAVDHNGAPLVGWRVEFRGDLEAGGGIAMTDDDGRFALSHMPHTGRCLLWPADGDLRLPVAWSPIVTADDAPVLLQLEAERSARTRLRLHPEVAFRGERPPLEVRVVQLDTGCGAHLDPLGVDGAFELQGLAAGPYAAEVGAPGYGWAAVGPVHVDGHGIWDLGAVQLQPPGSVRAPAHGDEPSPLQGRFRLFHRRDDTDVAFDPMPPAAGGDTVFAPAGDYAMLWRTDDDALHAVEVAVKSGETTVVE